MGKSEASFPRSGFEIAIIGMAGRFPGARNVGEFWRNLRDGVESISFFTDEELRSSGIDPSLVDDPNYVKARGIVEDAELFDASFFGYSLREAQIMDPQQRLFLECAWEALEHSGYDSQQYQGAIGVYAGVSRNTYWMENLRSNRELLESTGDFLTGISNDKDFLANRVSYNLNLKGPAVVVQAACSTSLVAVHLASQGLLSGECDTALSGAVTIRVPLKSGYLYLPEGISSPDGHCRPFDVQAEGTVPSSGVGVVVLKRLEDALADGDDIHAVISGSAINNDGSEKIGYTAPGVEGQAAAVSSAIAMAGCDPQTITCVEAHGTATALGDPIEIAALTQAFRARTDRNGFCAIGAAKSNLGHLDVAAGVAGLIKTVMALKHKELPPTLHYERPNPQIDFANSPFRVNQELTAWPSNESPRRAGVSSFGIGGTNAHVILEEAPLRHTSSAGRPWQLLVVSAKTDSALENATTNIADHLQEHLDLPLADVAYVLQVGRRAFDHRRILVCRDSHDAVTAIESEDRGRVFTSHVESEDPKVVFMFPGQGAQYANMGSDLYETEPVFRDCVDRCAEVLRGHLEVDLRDLLYPGKDASEPAAHELEQTLSAQPALFVTEYALAQL